MSSDLSALITPASVQDIAVNRQASPKESVQTGKAQEDKVQKADSHSNGQRSSEQVTKARLWKPRQVLFTPAALEEAWGQQIYQRVSGLGLPITKLKSNRITGLRGKDERETYARAKQTMAVVTAPPGQFKLQPIPPSADWQFHLAEGCPAHCQYCYLASSLSGPPAIRVYANLPAILENTDRFIKEESASTSFEVSCYTDPLSLEHLTGSLGECIRYFGTQPRKNLRWVSKFNNVEPLLDIEHNGRTRCRVSINADPVSKGFEGGTASVRDRIQALRTLALPKAQGGGGYPVGFVIAPIMAFEGWQDSYAQLFEEIATALDFECDLTFELITHRFTAKSKQVLNEWYPNSELDMQMDSRTTKRNKFGGIKYVYDKETTQALRKFFEKRINQTFANARILYWT
ncbi:spore photoproduct lyase family protein [cf. Phormidesmis sp. LEGE 11477]|uniref:spore photoproduct lyase family protein n=1 Tax=cf. Phormidesmis sp. LEGE 11477 TaxID=1828680 RepID=UPI001D145042|nr:radical SAM protein [cf. Phormidesmis sp. LEGE 11477]